MTENERHRFIGGPYVAPAARRGDILTCYVRDCDCVVTGWTAGRLPWPKGRARDKRASGPIVTEEMARAVATESAVALCYWLGLTAQTITKWRKALCVGRMTPGTTRVFRDNFAETMTPELRKRCVAAANTPEANAKKSAARIGKPRPRAIIQAMNTARLSKVISEETRRKMSESHKRRGTRPPKAGAVKRREPHSRHRGLISSDHARGVSDGQ